MYSWLWASPENWTPINGLQNRRSAVELGGRTSTGRQNRCSTIELGRHSRLSILSDFWRDQNIVRRAKKYPAEEKRYVWEIISPIGQAGRWPQSPRRLWTHPCCLPIGELPHRVWTCRGNCIPQTPTPSARYLHYKLTSRCCQTHI